MHGCGAWTGAIWDGLLVSTGDHLEDVSRRALAAGFQVGIHAIGDRGGLVALDAMERLSRDLPRGFGFEWTGVYYQQIAAGNTARSPPLFPVTRK